MGKSILIIEDNLELRENTVEILELAGFVVYAAENGKFGVQKAVELAPDLIICDIMMPELDGYGVLYLLSRNPKTSSIPFIFLSAKSDRTDVRKGMNMGADDYLTKPFEDLELLEAVEGRLKRIESVKAEIESGLNGLEGFIDLAKGFEPLKSLTYAREVSHYRKKEMIYLNGEHPRRIFLVQKGKVKTYQSNTEGKELITGLYSEGEYFGYLPLLHQNEYNDAAMAMEDTTLGTISADDFFKLLHTDRDIANRFIKLLSNQVKEREQRLIKLAYNSVRKRVADGLLEIFDKYKGADYPNGITISREDLSHMVGTASESVIRTLSEFKVDKLIEINGRKVKLLDEETLRKLPY